MKREIKFRAYAGKTMWPNVAVNNGFPYVWNYNESELVPIFSSEQRAVYGEPALMQYTGLKDKNGVEIYEGDVLRFSIGYEGIEKDRFRVCENQGAFGCRNMKDHAIGFRPFLGMENSLVQHGYYQDLHQIMEVIGNIYETPAPSIEPASFCEARAKDTGESEQGAPL